jgi:hypothetical protein
MNQATIKIWGRKMKTVLSSKRDSYVFKFGIFLITVALIAGMVGCGDTPPPSEDLEIRDWYDLDAIRDNMGDGYLLMNDLDSTTAGYEELASPTANQGKGWQPIGTEGAQFTGTFDGQGYEISDLFINRPQEYYVALFGYVREGGVVENVGMVNVSVAGQARVGGLVGENQGTVRDSYATSAVSGDTHVGGLAGANSGTVSNSYSTGSVTGDEKVGGLVGYRFMYGTVNDSFWDTQTSGQATSAGGTGKTTTQMKNIATFSGAGWDIIAVANPGTRNPSHTWNIVDGETYPFLSRES